MPSPSALITGEGRSCPGVKGGLDAARRIEDHADARDATELIRLRNDRIASGGGAAWWR